MIANIQSAYRTGGSTAVTAEVNKYAQIISDNKTAMTDSQKIMDDNQVYFQTAELGKVDVGGGGTIAYIAALYGMNVIDSGVAVLSMHAPWEVTSKADVYEAYKGYKAFIEEMR